MGEWSGTRGHRHNSCALALFRPQTLTQTSTTRDFVPGRSHPKPGCPRLRSGFRGAATLALMWAGVRCDVQPNTRQAQRKICAARKQPACTDESCQTPHRRPERNICAAKSESRASRGNRANANSASSAGSSARPSGGGVPRRCSLRPRADVTARACSRVVRRANGRDKVRRGEASAPATVRKGRHERQHVAAGASYASPSYPPIDKLRRRHEASWALSCS